MASIHPKLEEQIIEVIILAKTKGVCLDYSSTKNEKAALIYDDGGIVLLTISEETDCFLAQPYIIDLKKWAWAEVEGFSREDIWSKKNLQDMIFLPVTRQKLYEHFGIN